MSIQTVEIALPTEIDSVSVALAQPIAIIEIRQGPAGASGAGIWGTITGTITAQTDLVSYIGTRLASGEATAKNVEVFVRNMTGATIAKGSIVYINGASGNRPTITKAQADNDANSAQTIGFVKADIANNATGYVITSGDLENVNTQSLSAGQQLYLSPTTAGAWTTTKPSAPQHLVYVGIVVSAHPTQGIIYVAIQNGYELSELHDVAITSPSTGQFLKRNEGNTLWVNSGITSADITDASEANGSSTIVRRSSEGDAAFSTVSTNLSGTSTLTLGGGNALSSTTDGILDWTLSSAASGTSQFYILPDASGNVLLDSTLVPQLGLLSGTVTAAGAWAFSSPTRPTSAGTGTPAANSLITRTDALSESWQYMPTPLSFSTTTGTANSIGGNTGVFANVTLAGTAVAGNFREATCAQFPLNRSGSGANLRLNGSRFSVILDLQNNAFSGNELRAIYGADAAATGLSAAGFAVIWTSAITGEIRIHDGTTLFTQGFVCSGMSTGRINRFLITWNNGTLTLFEKSWTDSEAEPRWSQRATLSRAGLPASAAGQNFRIVNFAASNAAGFNLSLNIRSAMFIGTPAIPN
jgi:hypothetical protein